MRLVHWSADIVTKVHGRHQEPLWEQAKPDAARKRRRSGLGKPLGFWVSDETRGVHGWRAWCRAERFRSYSFRYEYEVKLSDKANILYLRTPQDIDDFADEYGSSLMEQLGKQDVRSQETWGGKYVDMIDWHRVAKKYQGIIITPYQWSRRMGRHMWYYTWDCASGCIWSARAIESITLVKERKVPHKPGYWEERRSRKRLMIKMAKLSKDMVTSMQETRPPTALDDALLDSANKVIESYGGKGETTNTQTV